MADELSAGQGFAGVVSSADTRRLFLSRFLRLFAYGSLSVVLALYLAARGLSPAGIGLLLTLALVGDTLVSLFLSARADRIGRRRTLIAGAMLIVLTAVLLGVDGGAVFLALAVMLGVVSPSGNEVGPFLAVEQAALAELVPAERRTTVFAWYNLTGAAGTALGALCGGTISGASAAAGLGGAAAFLPVIAIYALIGVALVACAARLSPRIEVAPAAGALPRPGLHRSRPVVRRLAALFALDAFGGGLVIQSVLAYWLSVRFDARPSELGLLFFVTNLLAGLSYLAAGWLAARIGLLRTMVFTHLPANLLLLLVPLMPSLGAAAAVLVVRALVTQMDVPTRQAYLMAIVGPEERAAAAGFVGVARSLGAALSPAIATTLAGTASFAAVPFFLAGALKIGYDLLLYRGFAGLRPEHERRREAA